MFSLWLQLSPVLNTPVTHSNSTVRYPFDTLPKLNSCWTGLTQQICKMALAQNYILQTCVYTSLFYHQEEKACTHGLSFSHRPLIIVSMKKVKASRTLLSALLIEYVHSTFALTISTLGLDEKMFSRHQIPKWEEEKYQDRHHPRWQHGGDLLIKLRNWMECE